MNYTLKIIKNGETIGKYRTKSKRRFLKKLRTINWKGGGLKVHIKVSYGKQKDVFGKVSYFSNEEEYDNKTDLWMAFNAFAEEK